MKLKFVLVLLVVLGFVVGCENKTEPNEKKTEPNEKKTEANEKKTELKKDIYKDTSTGLVWQDNIDNIKLEKSWYEAYKYCKDLELAGSSKWILPTGDMFLSIIDMKNESGIKSDFKYVKENYWTSDCFSIDVRDGKSVDRCVDTTSSEGFLADFGDSVNPNFIYLLTGDIQNMTHYAKLNVRCVQEPYIKYDDFTPDRLYIDSDTSLIWADTGLFLSIQTEKPIERKGTFDEAEKYCKELVVLNKLSKKIKDWRLPNIEELKTLIGKSKRFKNLKEFAYWSSTVDKEFAKVTPLVKQNAFVVSMNKKAKLNFMCVKDLEIKK